MQVQIPGEMIATVKDGRVTFTFMPLASHAGYFGEEFFILENEEGVEMPRDEFWSMVGSTLVGTSRETAHFICSWEE